MVSKPWPPPASSRCMLKWPRRIAICSRAGATNIRPDSTSWSKLGSPCRHRITFTPNAYVTAPVKLSSLLASVTVLLTPTTGAPAPAGQGSTGDWRFNIPFSASGHPAITLPCGMSNDGLPIGVQAVAAHAHEDRLFAVGKLFQRHSDWHAQRAPTTSPEYTT